MSNYETNRRPKPPLLLQANAFPVASLPEIPTRWLWNPYIPRNRVTLLIGDPGIGKSLLLAHLAACVTAAQPLPTPDPDGDAKPHPGEVYFGLPEDTEHDILIPRLTAAGADLNRAHIVGGVSAHLPRSYYTPNAPDGDLPIKTESAVFPLTLPLHVGPLKTAVCSSARLLILDPLHNFMARPRHANRFNLGCDGFDYRDSQDLAVTVMACLSDIARSGPAVVVVAHLTKKFDQSLLYRTRGSLGLVCGARSILYLAADQQDSNRRILSQIKSVSGPLAPPIAFRIQPGPRLEFEPPGSAPIRPDLLALPPEVHSALSEACAWLTDALAAGPRPSLEILTGSRSAGISLATLNRAKYLLRVRSIKFGSDWCWSNPEVPENSSFSK